MGEPGRTAQFRKQSQVKRPTTPGISIGIAIIVLAAILGVAFVSYFKPAARANASNQQPQAAQTSASEEMEPPSAGVTMRAYELIKKPYRYKKRLVMLDVTSRPVLYNGAVIQYAPGDDSRMGKSLGLLGLRFNRMISEDTALYDVMALDSTNHMDAEMVGQIVVIVPQGKEELDLGRYWGVEPLGIAEGTNAFGATLTVSRVRFWRYAD